MVPATWKTEAGQVGPHLKQQQKVNSKLFPGHSGACRKPSLQGANVRGLRVQG